MVSQKDKKRMLDFVVNLFEASPYLILQTNHEKLVIQDPVQGHRAGIFLHGRKPTIKEHDAMRNNAYHQGFGILDIFYKNDKDFFVRMQSDKNRTPEIMRADKSFKLYMLHDLYKVIHLRDLEKKILRLAGNPLTYFQPETSQLENSLRLVHMEPIILDYTHLPEDYDIRQKGDRQQSVNYVMPTFLSQISRGADIQLDFSKNTPYQPRLIPKRP